MTPEKNLRVALKIIMAVAGLVILLVVAERVVVNWARQGAPSPYRAPAASKYNKPSDVDLRITYRITGSAGSASLTYVNASGGTEQVSSVSLPWEKTIIIYYGDFVYISAQNLNESGSVTCEIKLEGQSWKRSTSSGAYTIATCSGGVSAE